MSEELIQDVILKHGLHNVHRRKTKRQFKPVKGFVPFSDNDRRKPLIGDGRGPLFTLFPSLGVSYFSQRMTEVWWTLENITNILDEITTQLVENPELKSVAQIAIQNRVTLDDIYAEQGGMCVGMGIDHCSFVANSSGNWTLIRDKVRQLKDFLESQEDSNPQ